MKYSTKMIIVLAVCSVWLLAAAETQAAWGRGGYYGGRGYRWGYGGRGWGWYPWGISFGFYPYYYAPYYWWPYNYYGYYGYPPPAAYQYPPPANAPAYQSPAPAYPQSDNRDFLKLGHDSGKALRLNAASQEWLNDYLRAYVLNAPPSAQDDFRRGFITGYGDGGESVFNKALEEARRPMPPPPNQTAPPAPGPSSPPKQ